ncbi:OmpH family outer membrane protein [Chondromyces apiculatus]|uniref:Outer membrane protein H n=1 Tax=Chondromyces apiculatus DSM 436 TaxID=1192034 RepID=A0A017T1D1_9BACT|nr:OmpH family outer membrane protein [Chondromyces apiculatus]EYF02812.1 Outer membrane protein H precursor [Chondromyces apiculatus DSM 436]
MHPAPAPRSTAPLAARLLGRGRTAVLAVALGLGAAALAAPSAAAAQTKTAVIDVRRAMLETEEGLRVQASLRKLFDSRQVEIDAKQRSLSEEQDKIEKEDRAGKTPKDQLARRRENLQRQAAEFQGAYVEYQREMQRKENELTTPILQKVLGAVRRLASQEGYEMVMEKSAVPYFRADLEVTDRVIQMCNAGATPEAPAAKPGAAPAKPGAAAPKPAAPAAAPKKP